MPLFQLLRIGFACLRKNWNFVSPMHERKMIIVRPYESEKIGKEAQRHPWTQGDHCYSLKGSRLKQQDEKLKTKGLVGTIAWPWWCPRNVGPTVSTWHSPFSVLSNFP